MEKKRNFSIDILKFIAVLLITNSHFDEQYVYCKELATGGAIGDALFFFCSGYTLFMGRMDRFDAWYKRRIRRIYPSILALSFIGAICYGRLINLFDLFISGGDWFVSCIMIYYVLLYFIRKYLSDHLFWVYGLYVLIVSTWFLLFLEPIKSICLDCCPFLSDGLLFAIPDNGAWIWQWNYLKWGLFFLFFMVGAHIGKIENQEFSLATYHIGFILLKLVLYTASFYGIQYACANSQWEAFQILSVLPLLGLCITLYRLTETSQLLHLCKNKYIQNLISWIGGLCLEIYLVQPYLRTTALNSIFPLNLVLLFILIVVVAYICRVIGRFFQQTFSSEEGYRWKEIVQL